MTLHLVPLRRLIAIFRMGDRHEAAHEAPPPGLPHAVGEVRRARRELVGCTPVFLARRELRQLPPHAWGGLGWGGGRTGTKLGNINRRVSAACLLTCACALPLLSGCAALKAPSATAAAHAESQATQPAPAAAQVQSAAPASPLASLFKPEPLSMTWIGDTLRHIAIESQAAANADQQRLQALGAQRTPADKLKLAYLLMARASPTADEATQAQDLLRGLDNQTEDPASKQFIRVLQRLSRQTLDLAQLRAELVRSNKQVADLQDKIGQIKNLEVELQDRAQSRPGQTKPGQTK